MLDCIDRCDATELPLSRRAGDRPSGRGAADNRRQLRTTQSLAAVEPTGQHLARGAVAAPNGSTERRHRITGDALAQAAPIGIDVSCVRWGV